MDYGDGKDRRRHLVDRVLNTPVAAIVVGLVSKQEGVYHKEMQSYDYEHGSSEYDPAYLEVTGTVRLWQVKLGLRGKILWARLENTIPHPSPEGLVVGATGRNLASDPGFVYSEPSALELPGAPDLQQNSILIY